MSEPTISVITPSYNQGNFLEQTITSVIEQDYPHVEYIVIDGGSTDQSVDIIKKHEQSIAYWQSQKDDGQSDAIQFGLQKATGDILCWINSDDYLLPGALTHVANTFQENPEAEWLVGTCRVVEADNTLESTRAPGKVDHHTMTFWLSDLWFPQQSTFWRKSLWDKSGGLDLDLHFLMDWDLWLKFFRHAPPLVLNEELASYRMHEDAKCVDLSEKLPLEEYTILKYLFEGKYGHEASYLKELKAITTYLFPKLMNEQQYELASKYWAFIQEHNWSNEISWKTKLKYHLPFLR